MGGDLAQFQVSLVVLYQVIHRILFWTISILSLTEQNGVCFNQNVHPSASPGEICVVAIVVMGSCGILNFHHSLSFCCHHCKYMYVH